MMNWINEHWIDFLIGLVIVAVLFAAIATGVNDKDDNFPGGAA